MRARVLGLGVVVSVASCFAASCFVPEATIESTGSMGSAMTSGASSGTGIDPNAFDPHVDGPFKTGQTASGEQEIAPTGNPMQRHLVSVPLPTKPEGQWLTFQLIQGRIDAARFDAGAWKPAGGVLLDDQHALEDGRIFGVDVAPDDSTLLHFAADWAFGSVHVEARAPDDGTSPLMFAPPVAHAMPSGLESDGAVTVAMPGGTVHDFGSFVANGTPCTSCVATRPFPDPMWTQTPLDFSQKESGPSPRGAVRVSSTPIVAWPLLGALAEAHITGAGPTWSGSELQGTAQVSADERTWAMCSKAVNGSMSLDAHALIANGASFTHLFTNSGSWAQFSGAPLVWPPNANVGELFMVCSLDVLYAFTIDNAGALLGTRYVIADQKWSTWSVLVAPPSGGLSRCFLSGFDHATHGEIGLLFTETADCKVKGTHTYYAVFLRIG